MALEQAVTAAVVAALKADVTLAGMVTGVFNHVPDETAMPYVLVEWREVQVLDGVEYPLMEHRLELTCFGDGRGQKEVQLIAAQVSGVLHRASLTVSGAVLYAVEIGSGSADTTRDGLRRSVLMVCRVLVRAA